MPSGGMLLSGDDLTKIPAERLAILRKLLPPPTVAAGFEDDALRVGTVNLSGARMLSLFNWEDEPQSISVRLPRACQITDYWR